MDFNNIREEGFWNDVAKDLNENFNKVGARIDKLVYKTEKAKGLFSSFRELTEFYPHPEDGDWALVGEKFPADLYYVTSGVWTFSNQTWSPGEITLNNYLVSEKITNLTEIL